MASTVEFNWHRPETDDRDHTGRNRPMRRLNINETSDKERKTGTRLRSRLAFRFHPRALAALGRDLVTNDVVAVMELVKNSYDALATRVDVRLQPAEENADEPFIEIADDGHGMDYATIMDVWCVIATPFRKRRPVSTLGRRSRFVTGEKGLGRLSAARLGSRLDVTTRTRAGPVLQFSLDWDEMQRVDDLSEAGFDVSQLPAGEFDGDHGTRIRISSLRSTWDDKTVDDLRHDLARLVSPFSAAEDFIVRLHVVSDNETAEQIKAPRFMSQPKYAIEGRVTADGMVHSRYRYRPLRGREGREHQYHEEWAATVGSLSRRERDVLGRGRPDCGPFEFEIRAWDLTKDDTRDIAEHFGETRSRIRGAIASRRGISVYRDDILVLPKSEGTRDWLGLDLRRVSKVGPRLSTSQLVGYVRITRAGNPGIVDTSDREGLVSNPASLAFERLMFRIVELLEGDRHSDRMEEKEAGTARDLFASLNTNRLVDRLEGIREAGGDVDDAIKATKDFGDELDRARLGIEKRFGYYNRLAVIGTIAQMVIHEIRNRTTVIGRGIRKAGELTERLQDESAGRALKMAKRSVAALESLADRFAPLASRGYRPGRRTSIVEESIDRCLAMHAEEIRSSRVVVEAPQGTHTAVRIDPGEIDAVMLNLLANALYWLKRRDGDRRLRFRLTDGPTPGRVLVSADDSGPGIHLDDRERVFWPGVTRKPDGIGMGLTVASELVDGHGGKMRTIVPGELGGATFEFDLPMAGQRTKGGRR